MQNLYISDIKDSLPAVKDAGGRVVVGATGGVVDGGRCWGG